ncbi:MAG: hypothetical protein KDK70_34600, partial [Myxococcales bacterium]|nr:hypothetical protein [Myxococcales bacterium]
MRHRASSPVRVFAWPRLLLTTLLAVAWWASVHWLWPQAPVWVQLASEDGPMALVAGGALWGVGHPLEPREHRVLLALFMGWLGGLATAAVLGSSDPRA